MVEVSRVAYSCLTLDGGGGGGGGAGARRTASLDPSTVRPSIMRIADCAISAEDGGPLARNAGGAGGGGAGHEGGGGGVPLFRGGEALGETKK